ncbi:MAG: ATP cone domain-containing protein [bacterium]
MNQFYVIKANGEKELFDYKKLENSLRKVDASDELISQIVSEISIEAKTKEIVTTQDIYRMAFSILRKKQRPIAVRYSLKKAVAMLGPTGFPFEKFVAEIFKAHGYATMTDQIVKGKCVEHEIDIVAWKNNELVMTEAKFHTDFNLKSDLKIVLYVKARYDDIFGQEYDFGGEKRKLTEGWIVTNTKFSTTAIQYGQCQPSLKFIGWNYPYNNNLHDMIERHELIPLTALTTITTAEKNLFLSKGIILSKSLLDNNVLKVFNFDEKKIKSIQNEVQGLCEHCRKRFTNN